MISVQDDLETAILVRFSGDICESAPIASMISESPFELAYCLALVSATEKNSLIPRWVLISYPKVDTVLRLLRNTSCYECEYCIDRFVIDEAYCFSAWGQDFRVDYLYIGDFIRELQESNGKALVRLDFKKKG